MTGMFFSRGPGRKAARAILALLLATGLSGAALAGEPKPPSVRSKLLSDRDRDVTIIIIDKDDDRPTSRIGAPSKPQSSQLRQPSGKIKRDDDDVTIRIQRDRKTHSGSSKKTGPKIIIIDGDSGRCKGGGVCVIRP